MKIHNVTILDLLEATEESIANIESIQNVSTLLVSPKTRHLITKLRIHNLSSTLETDAQAVISNGPYKLYKGTLSGQSPSFRVINGPVIIDANVPEEELDNSLFEGMINGPLLCPANLMKILNKKKITINGPVTTYPEGTILIQGHLVLDTQFAHNAAEGQVFTVIGKIVSTDLAAAQELVNKHVKLYSRGTAYVASNTYEAFKEIQLENTDIVTIPEGCAFISGSLLLDRVSALRYGKSIFVDGDLELTNDANLLSLINEIHTTGLLTVPELLLEKALAVCKSYRDIFAYEGSLMRIEGKEFTLTSEILADIDRLTITVDGGSLMLDKDIQPALLKEKVSLLTLDDSSLMCTREQEAALWSVTRACDNVKIIYHGEIPLVEKPADDTPVIYNCSYLKL